MTKKLTAIEQKNKAFHKLSDKEKRIAVAKDVIAQVEARKYRATPGTYLFVKGLRVDEDVQKPLLEESTKCNVCAVGAAFASAARLGNNLFYGQSERIEMKKLFGEGLFTIEQAFEGWRHVDKALLAFHKKHGPTSSKRLVAIFQNIIDNDGEFIL
jgi:hypothetical protein